MHDRIIVADDHPIFRDGIRRIVQRTAINARVIEIATNDALMQEIENGSPPTLLVLDLVFPGFNGAESIAELRQRLPMTSIVIISMIDDLKVIDAVMNAGADGFIAKSVPPADIAIALDAILAGDIVVRTGPMIGNLGLHPNEPLDALSPRQRQVVRLIGLGMSNKEIARELDISPFTVRIHVSAALKGLGVSTRAAAAGLAVEFGLI